MSLIARDFDDYMEFRKKQKNTRIRVSLFLTDDFITSISTFLCAQLDQQKWLTLFL